MDETSFVSTSSTNKIHVIIKVGEFTVNNIYKPPGISWHPQAVKTLPHPAVYVEATLTATMNCGNIEQLTEIANT